MQCRCGKLSTASKKVIDNFDCGDLGLMLHYRQMQCIYFSIGHNPRMDRETVNRNKSVSPQSQAVIQLLPCQFNNQAQHQTQHSK